MLWCAANYELKFTPNINIYTVNFLLAEAKITLPPKLKANSTGWNQNYTRKVRKKTLNEGVLCSCDLYKFHYFLVINEVPMTKFYAVVYSLDVRDYRGVKIDPDSITNEQYLACIRPEAGIKTLIVFDTLEKARKAAMENFNPKDAEQLPIFTINYEGKGKKAFYPLDNKEKIAGFEVPFNKIQVLSATLAHIGKEYKPRDLAATTAAKATTIAKPATTAAKPATTAAKPTTTAAAPATTAMAPSTTVAKPATTVAKPATTAVKPATATATPATAAAKPTTIPAKPATTVTKLSPNESMSKYLASLGIPTTASAKTATATANPATTVATPASTAATVKPASAPFSFTYNGPATTSATSGKLPFSFSFFDARSAKTATTATAEPAKKATPAQAAAEAKVAAATKKAAAAKKAESKKPASKKPTPKKPAPKKPAPKKPAPKKPAPKKTEENDDSDFTIALITAMGIGVGSVFAYAGYIPSAVALLAAKTGIVLSAASVGVQIGVSMLVGLFAMTVVTALWYAVSSFANSNDTKSTLSNNIQQKNVDLCEELIDLNNAKFTNSFNQLKGQVQLKPGFNAYRLANKGLKAAATNNGKECAELFNTTLKNGMKP